MFHIQKSGEGDAQTCHCKIMTCLANIRKSNQQVFLVAVRVLHGCCFNQYKAPTGLNMFSFCPCMTEPRKHLCKELTQKGEIENETGICTELSKRKNCCVAIYCFFFFWHSSIVLFHRHTEPGRLGFISWILSLDPD